MKKILQKQLVDNRSTNFFKRMMLSFVLGFLILSSSSFGQSCPLACDDEVNVSLDANCSAVITPDVMLEEVGPGCNYTVVVFGTNGLPLPAPVVDGTHIGKRLVVAVYLGNNSCWGHIVVEDKFRPTVRCARPDTIFCTKRNFIPTKDTVEDNCTPLNQIVKHTLYDSMIMYADCMNPIRNNIIGYRKISCYYTDLSNNKSDTCIHYVYFKKFLESDIQWPADTIYTCKEYNDSIPDPAQSGVPTVEGEPLFPSWGVCKAAVTYEDQLLPICPKSFKVLRTWTIIDWCMPSGQNVYKRYQIIKVIDDRGPILLCSPLMEISTDVNSCTGTVIIPPPRIIDECSNVSIQVGYKILSPNGSPTYEGTSSKNVFRLPNGFYRISELPLGLSWVIFRVTDECGNFTDCATEVKIIDKVPPVPVCDQKTVVSLTVDGTARIDAITFDDGSLDNCGIESYEVKRMDNGAPCKTANGSLFGPSVYFCCEDVGKTIMVALRVWDYSGNSNTCMVEVVVQDKIPPIVICPPNITISCEFAYSDLSVFGNVVTDVTNRKAIVINDAHKVIDGDPIDGYAYDGCGAIVKEFVTNNLKCGVGNIFRTFVATDPSGLSYNCTQTITIIDFTPNNITITWPSDFVSTTTCMTKVELDPSKTGSPIVKGDDKCNNIFKNYEDKVYTQDPDACLKVIRTWTIIDWCVYDPNSQNPKGYYTWKQILKISNTQAPTFNIPCFDRTVDVFGPNCGGNIDLVGLAKDDCTDSADLVWYHSIDLYNDKIPDTAYIRPYANASRWYPIGTHRVTFKVKDACGNENVCTYLLTVRDAKKPTPYCISSITTTVMPSSKNIEIWAKDFNLNSEDNCTPKDKLKYYFLVNNTFVPSMIFDCSNIGKNILRIYVVDEAGNSDYCEATMEIQDPNQVCKGTGFTIQGKVTTAKNSVMENVGVFLERTNPTGSSLNYTNSAGIYTFNTITGNTDYSISVEKNYNSINGVTTADIVAIQKHILGKAILDKPYKLIAADANNSGAITSADISEIRKLLLGVIPEYTKNKSWRFVPKAYVFNDPTNPFPFEEKIAYNAINRDQMTSDFIGIKIGDVTEDSNPNSVNGTAKGRTAETHNIYTEDVQLIAGHEQLVSLKLADDYIASGCQLSLAVSNDIKIMGVESGLIQLDNENFKISDNVITIIFTPLELVKIQSGERLFSLRLASSKNVKLSEIIKLNETVINAEMYNDEINVSGLELEVRSNKTEVEVARPMFVQNVPNPFSEQTKVSFTTAKRQLVVLEIYDLNGKLNYSQSSTYDKGVHEVIIKKSNLGNEGIYYLKISTNEYSETKKMVLIK